MRERMRTEVSVNSSAASAQLRMHVLAAAANLFRLTIPMPELKHSLLAFLAPAAAAPVRASASLRP